MKTLITKFVFLLFINLTFGQSKTIAPLALDRAVLSGLELKKIDLKEEPEKDFYQKMLFNGKDIMVFIVSTETWNNKIEDYAFDEYVYLLHGQSIVKPKDGNAKIFNYGDHFFIPKNFKGEWEINAGENLHYELSVISKNRSDSSFVSKNLSYSEVNRGEMSGAHISLDGPDAYKEIIREGVELTVSLNAEKPSSKTFDKNTKEKLIHLLSGAISFTDLELNEHTFYTGDFFVIPKGLEGTWKSDGHGLIKYLIIEKSYR